MINKKIVMFFSNNCSFFNNTVIIFPIKQSGQEVLKKPSNCTEDFL